MLFECVEELQLLLWFQVEHLREQFGRRRGANETGNVHVDEGGHKELTVEAVHDAAVAGNHVTKVLYGNSQRGYSLKSNVGVQFLSTLILKARLNPDAKKPPNGPMTELKTLIDNECNRNG